MELSKTSLQSQRTLTKKSSVRRRFEPLNFDFFARNSRACGLAAKSAPDRSLARNREGAGWDRPFGVDGCRLRRGWRVPGVQGPWSLRPRSAWKSPRASEAPWPWGSSSALSASRTPVPKPDALSRSRNSLACFRASPRQLAWVFFSASKLLETLRKFARFAAAGPFRSRFACQVFRAYSSRSTRFCKFLFLFAF